MTPTIRRCLLIAAAFAILGLVQNVAKADPLTLTITNPNLSGAPGQTLTFFASVTNTGTLSSGTDTITACDCSPLFQIPVPGGTLLSVDATPFGTNFLNQTVANLSTLGPLALFSVTIPTTTPAQGYQIFMNLTYLNAAGQQVRTNQERMFVTVTNATVPEPTTMLLLGTGLLGIAAKVKRRRKQPIS